MEKKKWTIYNGHSGEAKDFISGPDIAYAQNVKVVNAEYVEELQRKLEIAKGALKELIAIKDEVFDDHDEAGSPYLSYPNDLKFEDAEQALSEIEKG